MPYNSIAISSRRLDSFKFEFKINVLRRNDSALNVGLDLKGHTKAILATCLYRQIN